MSATAAASTRPSLTSGAGPSTLRRIDTQKVPATKLSTNIPTILITPPRDRARYSDMAPEQFYDKTVLFVPVKTEELGWDEHGLYWNGTYAYPVHNIYDKQGQPIGRRRKGPAGYRFEEYFEGKSPRGVPRTPDQVEMMESEIMDPFMQADLGVVEEAKVNLTEPAPARIGAVDQTSAVIVAEPAQEDASVDDPISPTLSFTSDTTEAEDGASFCDDSSSLWSRSDSLSDGDDSVSTSPGTLSPVVASDTEVQAFQAATLSKKLEQVASSPRAFHTSVKALSESNFATPKSQQSAPVALACCPRTHTDTADSLVRVSKSPKAETSYSSLIQDLSTSPFSSSPSRLSALSRSKTTRASSISSSPRSSSILRTSSLSQSRRPSATRRAFDLDFVGGWQFENESRQLSNSWQQTFLDE